MFNSPYHNGPTPNYPPRDGDISPWGQIQTVHDVLYGIVFVTTARHGGFLLSPERLNQMPEHMRSRDGWYEEDCEVAMPMYVFYDEMVVMGMINSQRQPKTDIIGEIRRLGVEV